MTVVGVDETEARPTPKRFNVVLKKNSMTLDDVSFSHSDNVEHSFNPFSFFESFAYYFNFWMNVRFLLARCHTSTCHSCSKFVEIKPLLSQLSSRYVTTMFAQGEETKNSVKRVIIRYGAWAQIQQPLYIHKCTIKFRCIEIMRITALITCKHLLFPRSPFVTHQCVLLLSPFCFLMYSPKKYVSTD